MNQHVFIKLISGFIVISVYIILQGKWSVLFNDTIW